MPTTPEMQQRVARIVEAFQIEHGIALPQMRKGLAARVLVSLLKMQGPNGDGLPRDSFLIPCDTSIKNKRTNITGSIGYAIKLCRRQHPDWHFTCRTVEGGIRCWRVK